MTRSLGEITRHQILLNKGDWDKLKLLHKNHTVTEVIRILVRRHINELENRSTEEKLDVE
jgi:hypothetical protein